MCSESQKYSASQKEQMFVNVHAFLFSVQTAVRGETLKEELSYWSLQHGGTKAFVASFFLSLLKHDVSVVKYPQDVHSREAQIYPPQHPRLLGLNDIEEHEDRVE